MRSHHLAPRLQTGDRADGSRASGGTAPLVAYLFLEAHPEQFLLERVELADLRRRYRSQQSMRGVQGAVGVVGGERLLVRPLVAVFAQLTDQAPVGAAQDVAKHLVPGVPHHSQQHRHVRLGRAPALSRVAQDLPQAIFVQLARVHGPLEFALDKRAQSGAQQLQTLANSIVVRYCPVIPR